MRRIFLLSLPFLLTSTAVAQNAAPAKTRTVVSDDAPASRAISRPASPPALSYEELRQTYRPPSNMGLSSLRANADSNSGRVVEITGRISGVMTTASGRTVIFNQNEEIIVFPMTLDVPGAATVSAGNSVRGLFLVAVEDAEVKLKPLAFQSAPAAPREVRSASAAITPAANTSISAIVLPPAPTNDNSVIIAQPGADYVLPQSTPMTRTSAPQRIASDSRQTVKAAITPAPAPLPANGDKLNQVYDALARRFNPKLTAAQSAEIGAAIVSASRAQNLDPRFLSAIIAVESDFDPYSLSSSGAMGLAQIMPFNLRGLGITNAWNPTQNINGAAKMLRKSLNDYKSKPDSTLLAVAAYNAGSGAVRRAGYKVPNGSQVQRYVWKVYNQYKAFAPELFVGR